MPEIEIRPVLPNDLPTLTELDHSYETEYVWQMDSGTTLPERMQVSFRQVRLPRPVQVVAPPLRLLAALEEAPPPAGLLVAVFAGAPVGYIAFGGGPVPDITWVTDVVVSRLLRRKGLGTGLVLAGEDWARYHHQRRLVLVTQPKNFPAIRLAQKLGFEFCGYHDRYYSNGDIGLFFGKHL